MNGPVNRTYISVLFIVYARFRIGKGLQNTKSFYPSGVTDPSP